MNTDFPLGSMPIEVTFYVWEYPAIIHTESHTIYLPVVRRKEFAWQESRHLAEIARRLENKYWGEKERRQLHIYLGYNNENYKLFGDRNFS
jgi:hypothetical protein